MNSNTKITLPFIIIFIILMCFISYKRLQKKQLQTNIKKNNYIQFLDNLEADLIKEKEQLQIEKEKLEKEQQQIEEEIKQNKILISPNKFNIIKNYVLSSNNNPLPRNFNFTTCERIKIKDIKLNYRTNFTKFENVFIKSTKEIDDNNEKLTEIEKELLLLEEEKDLQKEQQKIKETLKNIKRDKEKLRHLKDEIKEKINILELKNKNDAICALEKIYQITN